MDLNNINPINRTYGAGPYKKEPPASLSKKEIDKEKLKQFLIDNFDDFIKIEAGNTSESVEVKLFWKTNKSRQVLKTKLASEYKNIFITTGSCGD